MYTSRTFLSRPDDSRTNASRDCSHTVSISISTHMKVSNLESRLEDLHPPYPERLQPMDALPIVLVYTFPTNSVSLNGAANEI